VKQKIVTYVIAGFGLVAGLAWNDAIKSLIEYFFRRGAIPYWLNLSMRLYLRSSWL